MIDDPPSGYYETVPSPDKKGASWLLAVAKFRKDFDFCHGNNPPRNRQVVPGRSH